LKVEAAFEEPLALAALLDRLGPAV